jgi:hypothetical protein
MIDRKDGEPYGPWPTLGLTNEMLDAWPRVSIKTIETEEIHDGIAGA